MSRNSFRRPPPLTAEEQRHQLAVSRGQKVVHERLVARDPMLWNISPDQLNLATANDIEPVRRGAKILQARRADAFDALRAADGLTKEGHQASARYMRDWARRFGVADVEKFSALELQAMLGSKPDFGRREKPSLPTFMIIAARKITKAHEAIGGPSSRLMTALVYPLVTTSGPYRPWREVVEAVTGETDRKAQAARVRTACEGLAEHYDQVDKKEAAERGADNDNSFDDDPRAA